MLKIRMLVLLLGVMIPFVSMSAVANTSQLKDYLKELTESAAIPGLSFGLIEKGVEPTLISIGVADSQKPLAVTQNTIFPAASLSKPVLAYITLVLAERGQLILDQPLYKVLENTRIDNKQWAKLLTPRLVLSHQTGLPNWSRGDLAFNFKPGSDFGYSGEGYNYLQQVIEKITGLSFQALAVKEVFKPLNMQHSYFTCSEEATLVLAQGHNRAGEQVKRDIPKTSAAASLHTTAADYLKFISAWFDIKKISLKSRGDAFSASAKNAKRAADIDMGWGLGWGIYESSGPKMAWHWGDNGVFRAFVAIEPKSQKAFVYFTNSQHGLAIAKQVTEKIFPGNQGIVDWLGYGQSDSVYWQSERKGYEFSAKGQNVKAIESFEKVLSKYPDNQRLKKKVNWLKPLVEKPEKPIVHSSEWLEKVAGYYGERRLFVEQGALKYQRSQDDAHILTPLYGNVFRVGRATGFRLEVAFDESGKPVKLLGLYSSGYSDESVRTANKAMEH